MPNGYHQRHGYEAERERRRFLRRGRRRRGRGWRGQQRRRVRWGRRGRKANNAIIAILAIVVIVVVAMVSLGVDCGLPGVDRIVKSQRTYHMACDGKIRLLDDGLYVGRDPYEHRVPLPGETRPTGWEATARITVTGYTHIGQDRYRLTYTAQLPWGNSDDYCIDEPTRGVDNPS